MIFSYPYQMLEFTFDLHIAGYRALSGTRVKRVVTKR